MTGLPPPEEDVLEMAERHLKYQWAYVKREPGQLVDCSLCRAVHENGLRRPGGRCVAQRIDHIHQPPPVEQVGPIRPTLPERSITRRQPSNSSREMKHGFWEAHRKHQVHLDADL